jgi:phasin family protein
VRLDASNNFQNSSQINVKTIKFSGTIRIVAAHHFTGGLLLSTDASKGKIMFSNTQQFSGATKALFENQFAAFNALTNNIVGSVEKVVALNLDVVKASTEESIATAKQLLAAKDPQEFIALVTAQSKLSAEKAQSYGRHLTEIASSTQAELSKVVEAQVAETKGKVTALVSEVTKNAPAGSEQAVAVLKSIMDNASAGYEQLSKTAKQANETVEAHVAETTEHFSQTAAKTTSQVSKK